MKVIPNIPGLPEGYRGVYFTHLDVIVMVTLRSIRLLFSRVLEYVFDSRRQLWEKKFKDRKGMDHFDFRKGTKQVCILDRWGKVVSACRLVYGKDGHDVPGDFELTGPCVEISRCDAQGVGLPLLILAIWELARQEDHTFFVASFRAGFVEHLKVFDIPIEIIGEPAFHAGKKFLRVRIGEPDLDQFVGILQTWVQEKVAA